MNHVNIIAEIGINHNGDVEIAKQLIETAKKAGADIVKFQKRNINKVYSSDELKKYRESPWGNTFREQKEGLELKLNDYKVIDEYCKNLGIDWTASAWDEDSQNFLNKNFSLKYNKIASAMIIDLDHLSKVAKEKKYTFISTGMCELKDIDKAVEIFLKEDCSFELMHCVSTYPMDDEDANLKCINTLRERYNCKIGYSGHENGLSISYAAVALGATSIERHITLSKSMYGSDQSSSMEPNKFTELVGGIRKLEKALGDGQKKFLQKEISISEKLRSHIFNRITK
jgi:N-acetylneuraminate synthase